MCSIDTSLTTDSLFPPYSLIAAATGETEVWVDWTSIYTIYYLDTVSYKVYWSTQQEQGTSAEHSQASSELQTYLSGMPAFTKFYYTVTSVIGTYESSPSQESSFRTSGKIADLNITDDSLKAALSELYQTTVDEVDSLYLSSRGIKSIIGLEWFSSLDILCVDSNEIDNITPLQDMHSLKKLHARNNQITDIEVLLSLEDLSYVDLVGNSIEIPCDDLQQLIDSLGLGNVMPYQAIDGVTCTN
jgi:Leucine-rich repeat (LRR) protein